MEDTYEKPPISWKELVNNGKIQGVSRVQKSFEKAVNLLNLNDSSKYKTANYLGNSDYYLTKFRYTYYQRVSLGFTAEKDVGEPFFKNVNKYGFDFYSFHINVNGGKYLKNIILGDYHVQIGQGLNCWTSFALGKSLELTTSKKNAQTIRPHTSNDENRFFRGGAVDISFKRFSILLFASSHKKDASFNENSSDEVLSISNSGYHRTISEIQHKNKLLENVLGSYLQYNHGNLHVGAATIYNQYSYVLNKKKSIYNSYDFRGKHLQSSSVDYSFSYKNFLLFGEFSYVDFSSKTAFLQGVLFALNNNTSINLVYRNYDKAYETMYNAGFSDGNSVQNEKGLYLGITVKSTNHWNFQAYSDFFVHPWLKYNVDFPSKGNENVIQLTYKPSKNLETYLRFRSQFSEENSMFDSKNLSVISEINQQNIRLNFVYQLSQNCSIHSRIEGVRINRSDKKNENGFLFFQDFSYKFKEKPVEFVARIEFFDTDSYATRIYGFESNPLYQFSCPAYYGKGSRSYILVQYTLLKKIDFWIKFGLTNSSNLQSISSSETSLFLNRNKEINLQIRWRI